jgi:nucleoside-diphosphate-sugar epimerase
LKPKTGNFCYSLQDLTVNDTVNYMQGKTLVIGASGQIGIELVTTLRMKRGKENVIASDIRATESKELSDGPFEILNVLNVDELDRIVHKH